MQIPDSTTVANRIGRVALATALASLLLTVTNIPRDVWYDSFPSLTDPISVYTHVLMNSAVEFIIMMLVIPTVYVLLWGLSRRFDRTTVWRVFAVGSVVLAVLFTLDSGPSSPTAAALSIGSGAVFAAVVLLSVAVVEFAAGTDFVRPVSSTTLVGVTFIGIGIVAFAVVGVSTAGVVVADHAGYAVTDEQRYEQELEQERNAALKESDQDLEPTPDYTDSPKEFASLADDADGHHLLEHDNPEPPDMNYTTSYDPVETHVTPEYFETQSLEFETENSTETVEGHYHLEFDPDLSSFDAVALDSGYVDAKRTTYADQTVAIPEFNTAIPRESGTVKMESAESMWVYYDVVNEDGEVERYMAYLERGDL